MILVDLIFQLGVILALLDRGLLVLIDVSGPQILSNKLSFYDEMKRTTARLDDHLHLRTHPSVARFVEKAFRSSLRDTLFRSYMVTNETGPPFRSKTRSLGERMGSFLWNA